MKPPKYVTVVEGHPRAELAPLPAFTPYKSVDEVPQPVRQKIRELSALGEPHDQIARLIEIPVEWVDFFVREKPRPTQN